MPYATDRRFKKKSELRRNPVLFRTTDSVINWVEDQRGHEPTSSFIHRKLEKLRRLESDQS